MIAPPRILVIGLGALFSAYHLVLAVSSLGIPQSPWPVIVAMVLYAFVTIMSLWPTSPLVMPLWMAALNIGISIVISILVLSQLDSNETNGYATWSVAAVATLMTITAVRQHAVFAWIGIAALAAVVVIWSNPFALTTTGVIGGAVWVGVAHALSRGLAQAARDTNLYIQAELDAAAWHAAQEAHLHEGRYRLDNMNRVAGPMLHHIVENEGHLNARDRRESLLLEAAIRDEIRGQRLLNEDVRIEVMAARRRGIEVTLLDDGGLDDLTEETRNKAQIQLSNEIKRSQADKLIIRTGGDKSEIAVTLVGLRLGDDGISAALGREVTEDEVVQWLEIPSE